LSVCKHVEGLWITEYLENPFVAFFESYGFVRQPEPYPWEELPLPAVTLVRLNDAAKN